MPTFHVEFAAPNARRWRGWVLLALACGLLALASENLEMSKDELRGLLDVNSTAPSDHAEQRGARRTSGIQGAAPPAAIELARRELSHPWPQVFAEIDAARGPGARVISVEHEVRTETMRLVIEADQPQHINEALDRIASASGHRHAWTVEQITANGPTVEARLTRQSYAAELEPFKKSATSR